MLATHRVNLANNPCLWDWGRNEWLTIKFHTKKNQRPTDMPAADLKLSLNYSAMRFDQLKVLLFDPWLKWSLDLATRRQVDPLSKQLFDRWSTH